MFLFRKRPVTRVTSRVDTENHAQTTLLFTLWIAY